MLRINRILRCLGRGLLAGALAAVPAMASSHREAPFITEKPRVDGTDFYMFNSYEAGRQDFVTIIANYQPLQDPYGAPNFFSLDPQALYQIHIDNDGDAVEDLTFQFRFRNSYKDIRLKIGAPGAEKSIAVPFVNVGPIGPNKSDLALKNVVETYSLSLIKGNRRTGQRVLARDANGGSTTFIKPTDNIGNKSIANYDAYARDHIYDVNIPGCGSARVFAGQRKEPFVVNLGETFDLVNIKNPIGSRSAERNTIDDKNITSLILEVPKTCLVKGNPSIGAWTTASLPSESKLRKTPTFSKPEFVSGEFQQVSRLANPLVNELVIGLKDKDRFNASEPKDDAQFFDYVTHPSLPAVLEILFGAAGVKAPTQFPRTDLVAVFATGVEGLNSTGGVGEMMRLNTSIPAKSAAEQNSLGVLGGDLAGYPNGRRPGDDVVDISLRAVMGALLGADVAPSGQLPFTDGALVEATMFDSTFPYLKTPIPGSPDPLSDN